MEAPEWMIWLITGRCNLNCRHCYASQYRGEREVSTGQVYRVLDEAYELGVEHVNFTGGEPLLRGDLFKILEYCRSIGISASIFTNSTLVGAEEASKLARLEVKVYTSLDGPEKRIYELVRGRDTWERAIRGISNLRGASIPFHVNITVSTLNWRYAGESVAKAVELGATSVSLIPAMPAGNALANRVYPSAGEYREAVRAAAGKARELGVPLSLWCTPYAPAIVDVENVRYSVCREWQVLDISPSGRILLCDVLGVGTGNVVEQGLREAVKLHVSSPLYREVVGASAPEECSGCEISGYCRGGCYARSYILRGDLRAADPLCPRHPNL